MYVMRVCNCIRASEQSCHHLERNNETYVPVQVSQYADHGGDDMKHKG